MIDMKLNEWFAIWRLAACCAVRNAGHGESGSSPAPC